MIKLAYGLGMLDDMSLEEFEAAAKAVSEIGYDGLEPSVCSPATIDKEAIKAILDKYGLKFSGLRSGGLYDRQHVRFSDPREEGRRRAVALMKEMIDLAGYFQCDVLFGRVQGWIPEDEDIETGKQYIAQCVKECTEYCAKYGINFDYEPINRYDMNYNHTTRETMEFVQKINEGVEHKVLLLMDIYHSFLEDYQIGAAFVRSGELCGHVHFRDSNGGVPGTGIIDFKEVICILEAMGYDKWIAFEVGADFCDYEQGAADTYRFIKPILDYAYNGR